MTPLDEFLTARLDEDEAAAKAAASRPLGDQWIDGTRLTAVAAHIARHDPARVLREVEAKRKILNSWVSAATADRYSAGPEPIDHFQDGLEHALRLLATAWSDHPDYRQDAP